MSLPLLLWLVGAGEWAPCPPDETTSCAPDAPVSRVDLACCPVADRTLVPVGVSHPPTRRMGSLLVLRAEVTRGQYLAVVGSGPRLWAIHPEPVAGVDREALPATHLTWYEAALFANALSLAQGLEPAYEIDGEDVRVLRARSGWRLPTLAEWDRAAADHGLCDLAPSAWEWVEERERPDEWDPYTDAFIRGCESYADEGLRERPYGVRANTRLQSLGFRLVRQAGRSSP